MWLQSSNIDTNWKKLLDTVGVSDKDLKDESTAKFIYDFVEKHGGIEEANRQLEASKQNKAPPLPGHGHSGRRGGGQAPPPPPPHSGRGPPPPPNRNAPPPPPSSHHGHAPPPPPSRSAPPPPPSRHGGGGGGNVPAPPPPPPVNVPAPPPPPPISSGGGPSSSSGGPPPPPPQSNKASNLPVVSDARANLMESIRAGKQLHKVNIDAVKKWVVNCCVGWCTGTSTSGEERWWYSWSFS